LSPSATAGLASHYFVAFIVPDLTALPILVAVSGTLRQCMHSSSELRIAGQVMSGKRVSNDRKRENDE